ncbi:MAG TPA: type II CAAX endopeptidase family protein [Pyrinomonadaceae bacterium]|nr:type II CAAX endopeptidase family protein [Pyrinomonadaceae bacterium]
MSTSNEPAPTVEEPSGTDFVFGPWPVTEQPPAPPSEIDPNNPPWGVVAGLLTWFGSVVLLFGMALAFLIPYIALRYRGSREDLVTDKTALLLQILSAFPAHLLTLGIAWAVVTRFGKRPFWRALGFDWGEKFGFWTSAGLAVGLLALGLGLTKIIGGEQTQIDQIVNSSTMSRYALAILAATTAPFVEEVVYRGVLFSALQKTAGMVWAIVGVSFLFTAVHVLQYYNNLGVIIVISMLSISLTLVRAFTGRLLPCFVMHLIFNGIQSIVIIAEPYFPQAVPDVEQKAPALLMLARSVRHLI